MKDIDQLLEQYMPKPTRELNSDFSQTVITNIQSPTKKRPTAISYLRKLRRLPKLAIIGLGIALAACLGTGAYAAYQWLAPEATIKQSFINDDKKREYSIDLQNCGVFAGGTLGNGIQRFELAKYSTLTDSQVKKVLTDTCAYRSLSQFIDKKWQGTRLDTVKQGQAVITYSSPDEGRSTMGTVMAISPMSITVEAKTYQEPGKPVWNGQPPNESSNPRYYPEGRVSTATYPLTNKTEVWYRSTTQSLSDIKVGDTVSVMLRYSYTAEVDGDIGYDNPTKTTTTAALIKSDVDPAYVQLQSLGNPKYIGPIFQLTGCDQTPEYDCLSYESTAIHKEVFYAVTVANENVTPFNKNSVVLGDKYFRADMPIETHHAKYHTVQGRIIDLDKRRNTVTIQSRGVVKAIAIQLPTNVLDAYAKNTGKHLAIGGMLQLDYAQQGSDKVTDIKPSHIYMLSLVQYQLPDGTYVNY